MIVTKKTTFFIFVLLSSVLFFILAFKSYLIISSVSSASEEEIKILSENIFFWGLIGTSFIFLAGLRIIIKSFAFDKSLDKLLNLSRTHGYSAYEGLTKLGKLGNKLSEIYFELDSLSERKSRKISSLNRLISLIFSFIQKKIIVISITGEILFTSESLIKGLDKNFNIANARITDFFPDFNLSTEINEIVLNRTMKEIKSIHAQIFPVFNNKNDLDFLVFFLDEQGLLNILPSSINLINSISSNKKNKLNFKKISTDFFRKRKKP